MDGCRGVLAQIWDTAVSAGPGSHRLLLADEMFYFYHIAHMVKHFEVGGCGIRPFLDLWIMNHRMEHWYSEFFRVHKGVEAWRKGDVESFGKLSFESGYSSIYSWETGSPELKALYEIMTRTEGIYGGRFSGAGFKGCCMALIDPAYEESIKLAVESDYLKEFPQLEGKYSTHICDSADGILNL